VILLSTRYTQLVTEGGVKMGIFDRKPNLEKLKAKGNLKDLIKALDN